VKKTILSLFLVTVIAGFAALAESMGKRNAEVGQVDYRLEKALSLPPAWTAVHLGDERPTVVAAEESITFLAPSGQERKTVRCARHSDVFISKGGGYVGVRELGAPPEDTRAPRVLSFTLYDHEGRKLWSAGRRLEYDDPLPGFSISSAGRVVMVESPQGVLSFYDHRGSVDLRVSLFPDALWMNERSMAFDFSGDGARFIVNALETHPRLGDGMTPRRPGQSVLVLFDARGTELWRKKLDSELPAGVAISEHGDAIAAGGYTVKGLNVVEQSTFLYDGQGELLTDLAVPFRFADFSNDGTFLLLGRKSQLHLVQTTPGKILWERSLPGESGQLRTLALSSDGGLILALQAPGGYRNSRFVYTHPRISVLDHSGHQIWQGDFPEDSFLRPAAGFLKDGISIFTAFTGRFLIYAPEK